MPKYYTTLIVPTSKISKDEVDLAKVLNYFEHLQCVNLNFVSVNYRNSLIHLDSSPIGGGRFFSKQLTPIVNDSKPNGHYYWFKILYEFYQISTNKEVALDSAIQQVIKPHVQSLANSYAKIRKLYLSKIMTKDPIVVEWLRNMDTFLAQHKFLTQKMPLELIDLAKKLGGTDSQTLSNKLSDVYESKTSSKSSGV